MPEPRCTLCMTLLPNFIGVRLAHAILDWHDQSFRTAKYRWQGGPESYRRCCIIYETAKEALELQTEVAA